MKKMNAKTFLAIILALLVVLVVAVIFSLTWGMFLILGFILISMAVIMVAVNRGAYLNQVIISLVGVGILFLLLSFAGFEPMEISLEFIPFSQEIHNLFVVP